MTEKLCFFIDIYYNLESSNKAKVIKQLQISSYLLLAMTNTALSIKDSQYS